MKLFALLWVFGFLLTIRPVMRIDNDRAIRKRWADLAASMKMLSYGFNNLGLAARLTNDSIESFNRTMKGFNERV